MLTGRLEAPRCYGKRWHSLGGDPMTRCLYGAYMVLMLLARKQHISKGPKKKVVKTSCLLDGRGPGIMLYRPVKLNSRSDASGSVSNRKQPQAACTQPEAAGSSRKQSCFS